MKIPSLAPLRQQTEPFDDPDWIYEIKHDGFRALAMIEQGTCRFVSRKNHALAGYRELGAAVAHEVKAKTAILDGELVVTDPEGRTVFASMMQRGRHPVRYFAFDLLWLDGKDVRLLPLLRRKALLKRILPSRSAHLLYVRHLTGKGQWLYERVCELDLEGIVAKRGASIYQARRSHDMWIKIKNPDYSQKEGRHEWFDRLRRKGKH
jgi:bifunctional non-homologous end joining protein LigD